jgi:hypothetical protein
MLPENDLELLPPNDGIHLIATNNNLDFLAKK